jgi:hypothetical protein
MPKQPFWLTKRVILIPQNLLSQIFLSAKIFIFAVLSFKIKYCLLIYIFILPFGTECGNLAEI